MEKNEENTFVYDDDEAVEVIIDHISEPLRKRLSREALGIILDLRFDYLESVNIVGDTEKPFLFKGTADVDEDALDE